MVVRLPRDVYFHPLYFLFYWRYNKIFYALFFLYLPLYNHFAPRLIGSSITFFQIDRLRYFILHRVHLRTHRA